MPKAASPRCPYRLPPPIAYCPPYTTSHGRSMPLIPSPSSASQPGEPLHTFSSAPTGALQFVKREEQPDGGLQDHPAEPYTEEASNSDEIKQEHEIDAAATSVHRGTRARQDISNPDSSGTRATATRLQAASGRTSSSVKLTVQVTAVRRQLSHAHSEIEELKEQIRRLESSEKRFKKQASQAKELVKDTKVEMEETRTELFRAEEKLDKMEVSMTTLRHEFNQYRGWWLTENRSLKMVLREVPKRKRDAGLEAIASSSYSRYMAYCVSGSN